jgi:hypothetical protein
MRPFDLDLTAEALAERVDLPLLWTEQEQPVCGELLICVENQ